MATRKMQITMEVTVTDLSERDRGEMLADLAWQGDDIEALPTLADYADPDEIAGVLTEYLEPEACADMFAGTGVYVSFSEGLLIGAEWLPEPKIAA